MPKIRPLTSGKREAEQTKKCNEVLAVALRRHRVDTGIQDQVLCKSLGISRNAIINYKRDPGVMTLDMARKVSHAIKVSPEDWLAIGGYKV
ncbi:helix-turn-helix transcriptional regulator [Intestinimonas butyriciproducens]|uniref:helix-turn-helix transcriptional regulator n=1 Tax=Intestinimonas butyriciproducens TaxID=1297617 RepID=UPI000952AA59|nr:helix-turn-helix transcriptional regulator [Intestinimonas butyriciproducens]OLR66894.1 hypothetical protein BIV19_04410 [Intestinimonas butyriciproducens]